MSLAKSAKGAKELQTLGEPFRFPLRSLRETIPFSDFMVSTQSLSAHVPLTSTAAAPILRPFRLVGGVLVSTMKMRQRRHAEDGSLAS